MRLVAKSSGELFAELKAAGDIVGNTWRVRQNDAFDQLTNFIYHQETISQLREASRSASLSPELTSYAAHRWRNFKRHEAWLSLIFETVPGCLAPDNSRDKLKDFIIEVDGTTRTFDLKVTRFPFSLQNQPDISDASLADWFYRNQSQQGRRHMEGRFFVVGSPEQMLYDNERATKVINKYVSDRGAHTVQVDDGNGRVVTAVVLRVN